MRKAICKQKRSKIRLGLTVMLLKFISESNVQTAKLKFAHCSQIQQRFLLMLISTDI